MTRSIRLELAEDADGVRCGDYCPQMTDRDHGLCGAGFSPTLPYARPPHTSRGSDRTQWQRSSECLAAEASQAELERDAEAWRNHVARQLLAKYHEQNPE
jgi:hypothetical protein